MSDVPQFTIHAERRWTQRCSGIDRRMEWLLSRKAGKNTRKRICKSCPAHVGVTRGRSYRGLWYMVGPSRVVFIVADKANLVLTVLRLPDTAGSTHD